MALGISSLWPAFAYSPRASLQSVREALTALRSQRRAPPALEGFTEFRGVVHAHTHLSHDSRGTDEEILAGAKAAGLDFLITTDHYTPRIYQEGIEGLRDLLVVRGVEIGLGCVQSDGIRRRCGSVLALGIMEPLMPDATGGWDWDTLFKAIRAQGALSIIAHPRGLPNPAYFQQADGMEIYDMADTMRDQIVYAPRALLDFAFAYADYPEEFFIPLVERPNWNLVQWDSITKDRRFVGLAGNDAHQNLRIFGRQVDRYDLVFRALNMHVLAPSLTMEHLIAGMREGRCFAAFSLLADAAGFQFVARDRDTGELRALLGQELKMQEGLVFEVHSPIPGSLLLLRDGIPVQREEGRLLRHAVERSGVYRVEVSLKVVDRWRPWIFANPIYLRA